MNLIDGIHTELERARQLLEAYQAIPTGIFGEAMIKMTIDQAEMSMKSDNISEMVIAYERLKNLK